jgi:TolB-like protein/Tfp pilus assembly protein PilF
LASTGVSALDKLLVEGYPDRSAILVEGLSGNERDLLAYRFLQSGLGQGDFCAFITRLPPSEVISDAMAFQVDFSERGPYWMSPDGGDRNYAPNDLATISLGVKELLKRGKGGRSRVAFDGLSQLLMLHSADPVYRFLSQLLPEVKKHDAVILATIQEEMHQLQVLSAMELLFDGVIVVRRTDQGELDVHIKKMRGMDLSARSTGVHLTGGGAAPSHGGRPRLAVLPFSNISPDPKDEYLSDGLTEELISTLSKVEGLEVIARTSVMHYKASPKPVSEVCRELRVGTILEGSARRAGNKIRVTVQMIDAEHDRHLWAESYDRDLEDIFAIQTEISEMVAESVRLKLDVGTEPSRSSPVEDPVAYDYYLRGRHLLNAGANGPEEAARYLRLAIEKDPKLARAYSGLADYYSYIADDTMPSSEAYPKAREYAQMALRLDPNLSDAHVSLALIAFLYEWDWPAAEKHFADSVRLNPNNAFAHHWYGLFLKSRGKFDRALESLDKAEELDPFSDATRFSVAVVHWCKGEDELTVAGCKKALELNKDNAAAHVLLGFTHLKQQDRASALLEAKEADRAGGERGVRGFTGFLYGKLGKTADAQRILGELRAEGMADPIAIAQVLLGLGEKKGALDEFRKAVDGHSSYFPIFNRNPTFDEMLSERQFLELLARANLSA